MADDSASSCDSSSLGGREGSEPDEGRRCAKNLPWQKIFHKRIAPVCTAVMDERERNGGTDAGLFKAFAPANKGETKRVMDIGGEKVVVQVVRDPRKPPSDMAYDQITLVLEDPDNDLLAPIKSSSDGIYLVREISSFSLSPNKGCINERLFMDRKRENYKSKGWGVGRWRVWLALEDVDAARKKRKKAEIAMLTGSKKKYALVTPPTDVKRSLSDNQHDVHPMATSKRVKNSAMESNSAQHTQHLPMNVMLPRMQLSYNPGMIAPPSFMPMSAAQNQQHLFVSSMQESQRRLQQQMMMNGMNGMTGVNGLDRAPLLNPPVLQPNLSMPMPDMNQVWINYSPPAQYMSLSPSPLMSLAPSLSSIPTNNMATQTRRF